jgi:hypothetical protein
MGSIMMGSIMGRKPLEDSMGGRGALEDDIDIGGAAAVSEMADICDLSISFKG